MEIGATLSVLIPLIAALFKFWLDRAPERKEKAENEKIQQGRQDIADGNVAAVSERIDSLPKPQVILQDSVTMKIQKGDLPKSPEANGWLLSDSSLAKLLEAAEKCQVK